MDVYSEQPLAEMLPSQAQLNREAALRRFNRLYVYTPLALGTLVCLVLVGWLLWGTIIVNWFSETHNAESARALASGLADTIFIIVALPWGLFCAALPLLFFAGILRSRRQGSAPLRRIQRLFWRLDDLLHRIDQKVNDLAPHLAHYVVAGNAWLSHIQTTVARLAQRRE
ncbi:MAG: hypothetical protein Fur0021_32160 [Candidatus Promineifilaceae bacterium]